MLNNGNLYESTNGALGRNLEVLGARGSNVLHRWRDGGPPFEWHVAHIFADDAEICPTLIGTTFDGNMEAVYVTRSRRLHHWWSPSNGTGWNDAGLFGPPNCTGVPGFIQSSHGDPGNLEVVVLVDSGELMHLWRDAGGWHEGARFGSDLLLSGATLVQSSYGTPHGNLEVVALRADGRMQHFWRDESFSWHPGAIFGADLRSVPVMIQSNFGRDDAVCAPGNFELCIARSGRVEHWWRNNADGSMSWERSATFGDNVQFVSGLAHSQWGNLEVIVVTYRFELQHYWRDAGGWNAGPLIGPVDSA